MESTVAHLFMLKFCAHACTCTTAYSILYNERKVNNFVGYLKIFINVIITFVLNIKVNQFDYDNLKT